MRRALGIVIAAFALVACPQAATTTCTVIHLADEACMAIEVQYPDGGIGTVQMSAFELQRAALATKARREDGGVR